MACLDNARSANALTIQSHTCLPKRGRSITGNDTVATNIPTARNRLSAGGSNSLKVQSPWAHGRKALTKTITKIKSRYMPIGGSTTKATCLLPTLYIVAPVFLIFFYIP